MSMKVGKKLLLFVLLSHMLFAGFDAKIFKISSKIEQRMLEGNGYKKGCPVGLKDLRYVKVRYKNFLHQIKEGELIVHHSVVKDVVNIFRELYHLSYPIAHMALVSDYKGRDWHSIEADNTSAFNCRHVGGTSRWSRHSFGKAIDMNPIENPYVSRRGYISHKASLKYKNRSKKKHQAMILNNDKVVQIFRKYGWKWGGDFKKEKDYQHFYKP